MAEEAGGNGLGRWPGDHREVLRGAAAGNRILDATDAEAKQIVDVASKTDGIVFSLWQPEGAKAPLGEVKHPQAVGHVPMTEAQYKDPKR